MCVISIKLNFFDRLHIKQLENGKNTFLNIISAAVINRHFSFIHVPRQHGNCTFWDDCLVDAKFKDRVAKDHMDDKVAICENINIFNYILITGGGNMVSFALLGVCTLLFNTLLKISIMAQSCKARVTIQCL